MATLIQKRLEGLPVGTYLELTYSEGRHENEYQNIREAKGSISETDGEESFALLTESGEELVLKFSEIRTFRKIDPNNNSSTTDKTDHTEIRYYGTDYRVLRQMHALESAEPFTFDSKEGLQSISVSFPKIHNSDLKRELGGIIESIKVAVKNKDIAFKYHDLRARTIKAGAMCSEAIEYENVYILIGILSIIAEDYEYALEPLIRAKKYVWASYAATKGQLIESSQVLSLCALLSGESGQINKYISEICVAYREIESIKELVKRYKDNQDYCELLASCAYIIYSASKGKLRTDITPYDTAYDSAIKMLEAVPMNWPNKKSAFSYWKDFESLSYPVQSKENKDTSQIFVGYIYNYNAEEKWGFITKNKYFYISQVRNDIEDGVLLRKLLYLGLWNNIEVKYMLGKSPIKEGQMAAYSISLTSKGYTDAQKRVLEVTNAGRIQKGFIEAYFPEYSTGRIQVGDKKYHFKVDSIVDPWLRAYYQESFAPKDQDVSFTISGKNATDICWLNPLEEDRNLYADHVTDQDISVWNKFLQIRSSTKENVIIPEDDPYQSYPYIALNEAQFVLPNIDNRFLIYGGKSPITGLPTYQIEETKKKTALDLSSYYKKGEEFAFLVISSNHFGRLLKSYEPGYSGVPTDKPIIFETPKIKFSTGKRPNVSKSVWLVRFERSGTMLNPYDGQYYPTVASGSTITVIKEYRKNNIKRLKIDESNLRVEEHFGKQEISIPQKRGVISNVLRKISEPIIGESVIYLRSKTDFSSAVICSCYELDGKKGALDKEGNHMCWLDDHEDNIWRFGHITSYEPENGIGIINNAWSFSLDVATQVLNILKSQSMAQNAIIGLYCIFSCKEKRINDIRRIREIADHLPWIKGKVINTDRMSSDISIEAEDGDKLIHHSTVETNPYVNRCFNQGKLIGESVWMRRIHLCWCENPNDLSAITLRAEAIALHSVEQSPVIQYVESTDSFEGYINQTEKFPIVGTRSLLQSAIGKVSSVVFAPSLNETVLECRIKGDSSIVIDEAKDTPDNSSDIADTFIHAPLVQLYLNNISISQTSLRNVDVDESGMPRTASSANDAFRQLIDFNRLKYPRNWQNHLFAAKVAISFPDEIKNSYRVPAILLGVLRMRVRAISRNPDVSYGELGYGLSTLMHYDRQRHDSNYYVWLLLQDYGTAEEILTYENSVHSNSDLSIADLCGRVHDSGIGAKVLGHLLLMDFFGIEQVCPVIENDNSLYEEIKELSNTISETTKRCNSLSDIVNTLKNDLYHSMQEYSHNIANLCLRQSDISEEVRRHSELLLRRWTKVFCIEDRNRLTQMIEACGKAANYSKLKGFEQQENELLNAWRSFDSIEKECINHPCKISTEVLLFNQQLKPENSVFEKLKNESAEKLSRLYGQDSLPDVTCELNEESIPYTRFNHGEADVELVIKNGDSKHMLQPAESVVIHLESLSPGIHVTPEIRLDQKLAVGEETSFIVSITADNEDALISSDIITFTWQAEFLYTGQFKDGHSIQQKHSTYETVEPLHLEIISEQYEVKEVHGSNPYKEAALGGPLKENSIVYRHRMEEDEIIRSILYIDKDGAEQFRSGATVIVHGQKKSGKTSLMNQIKAYIDRNDDLRDRAIIIDFDSVLSNIGNVMALPRFIQAFCDAILQRFDAQLSKHVDVWDMMDAAGITIPDLFDESTTAAAYSRFSKFVTSFSVLDKGYHTLILFMDEFTTLCTTLLTEIAKAHKINDVAQINYLQHIPDFIKDFSGKGFVQIVIGHENMMRSLDTLGMLNQTKEFATNVLVSALRPEEAEALIKSPMQEYFGYDTYRTTLGASAIEYLKDVSGCHPTFLIRACKEVFDYYIDENRLSPDKTQLTKRIVREAINNYVSHLELADFDILFVEDGDDVEKPEERKTYQYLKCVAELSLASYDHRTADAREVVDRMTQILGQTEEERIRGILHSRHVIRFSLGGRICIETGLFLLYIQQRN